MSYVQSLIDAVALEIQEQKKKKNDHIYNIYDGKKVKILTDEHVYLFITGELISFLDDSIAEIEIDGKTYDCTLNSNKQNKIQITLLHDKGNNIAKAKLHLNPWYLLELLSKKLCKNINNNRYFQNSYDLVCQNNKEILQLPIKLPTYLYQSANKSQLQAITHSLQMSQTIIWGPPGTGKTATIANIIQNFIKLKKSVLLVSLSNNAVDQALFKVLDSIKNKVDLKFITRLGIPKSEMLPYFKDKYYPILLGDKIKLVCSSEIEKRKEVEKSLINTREEYILRNKVVNDIEQKNLTLKKICELEYHYEILKSTLDKTGSIKPDYRDYYSKLPIMLQELKQNYDILVRSIDEQLTQLNTNESLVSKPLPTLFLKKKSLSDELEELNKKIESATRKIVKDSLVIATTVTKSYTDKYIDSLKYDVIVVDEASMVPMPMLFWAVSKSRERTIIVGDFLQLPPICLSEYNPIFKKNIFDELQISNIELAEIKTKLLNTQYRMNPEIAQIVNDHFYKKRLNDSNTVRDNVFSDDISNDKPVMFIDTSLDNPIATNIVPRSRVNLYHAIICISIAKMVMKRLKPSESIGILTPYNKQARLINKILIDEKLNENYDIKVNTIHSFQGGEETVIIFDTVEGRGLKSKWSMLNNDDYSECSNLLNVAITRAKSKLYIVGNYNFFRNNYPKNSDFNKICRNLVERGNNSHTNKILSFLEGNYNELKKSQSNNAKLLTEINLAKKEIIIISSSPSVIGLQRLHKALESIKQAGTIVTIMINKYNRENKKEFYKIAEQIIILGYNFKIIDKDNQSNIIIIDRKKILFGDFDILGQEKGNYLVWAEYPQFVKELVNLMRLDELIKGINGQKCPECKANYIETCVNHRNKQLYHACISSKCGFTRSI